MGKNHEQLEIKCIKEIYSTENNVLANKRKDSNEISLDYTNRRRIKEILENKLKTNPERKVENDQEFENLCLQIQECSISESDVKSKLSSGKSSLSSSDSLKSDIKSEVEAFRKFVEVKGGHYGGWKVKDHLYFLKVRSKCPLQKTAEIIHEHYPDIEINTVLEHDVWYNQYCKLRNANKIAIEEWKNQQKQPVKEVKVKEPEINVKSKSGTIKRDPNIKEKIDIWRAKTLATNLERLEIHRQEEIKKKMKEEEKKKMQNEKKNLVNRYREEKINCDMAMKAAEEVAALRAKRETVQQSAMLLKYFRYEDRKFSERQKSRRQPKVRDEPKVKAMVQVERDPSRLLRPTQGWIQHIKKSEEADVSHAKKYPLYIRHMKKLGKPAWRKSITA